MRWSSSSTPRSTLYAASRVFVIRSRWSAGSCTNAFMRAAVSRLRSSRFWMRTSSRSCGVSAPTRAVSTGIAAISPKRCFQKSMSSCSLLPTSAARPASTGLSSFFAIFVPLISRAISVSCSCPTSESTGCRRAGSPGMSRGRASLSRYRLTHVRGDLFQRRPRRKDALDAHFRECGPVRFRDDAASEEKDVVEALLLHQLADAREDVVVRAREQREANGVGVLLQRCLDDLFRCLMHTGVNDFHPGIAQRPCHDFRAAIVPVETGLCDDDADGPFHSGMPSSAKCSSQWRYV